LPGTKIPHQIPTRPAVLLVNARIQEIPTSSSFTSLQYHLIFSTKKREPLIQPQWKADLHSYMGGIVRSLGGTPLIINGMPDHVHLAVRLKPAMDISDTLKVVKAKSSKWMNENAASRGRFSWQRGYAAFSVSASMMKRVITYIANQEEHHRYVPFEEEYLNFLKRHGIEYDARYVFD
jgi:REP element-mobilizing transposase RayT